MKIEQKIRDEIAWLQTALLRANAHFHIGSGLLKSWGRFRGSISRASTFWDFTLQAHLNITLVHLCRLYVESSTSGKNKGAFTIQKFLDTVEKHWASFTEEDFKKRYAGHPRLNELVAARWKPTRAQFEEDRNFCDVRQAPVSNLCKWRNEIVAHANRRWIGDERSEFVEGNPIPALDRLIERGLEMVGRYNSAFQTIACLPSLELDDYLRALEI